MRFRDDTNISIEQFITRNEYWDISRQVDDIFTIFYLHGTTKVYLEKLQSFDRFVELLYRDNCLCIRVLNEGIELDGEALEIAKAITDPRVETNSLERWHHMQTLKASILSTFEQYEEGRIADFEALHSILCDTHDLTVVIPESPICWLEGTNER